MMKGRDSALFLPTRRGVLGAIPAAAMVSSAVAAAPPRTTALSPEATKAIGGMVDGFVAQNRADGLSVAVVMNGVTRFFNAGVTSQTTLTAATEHHVYEIGSVSKTFTALILASAIKEGRVALNDPVRKFLPPGFDNLAKDGRGVTFADIVTTTSALPDNVPDYLAVAPGAPPKQLIFAAAQFLDAFPYAGFLPELAKVTLLDKPGVAPRHSNAASVLLGVLLERIYGRPYADLLSRYVEKPLGLGAGTGEGRASLQVAGYGADATPRPRFNQPVMLAAAGLHYSAADMANYLTAQIDSRTPAIALSQQPLFAVSDADSIAFHWTVGRKADSKTYLRHSGGTFGCSTYCDFHPDQRFGIVLLANRVTRDTQEDLKKMAEAIHLTLFGAPAGLARLHRLLEASDYSDVTATVALVKRQNPELFLKEDDLNDWAYRLLKAQRVKAAVGLAGYNAAIRPESWNAHDTYGEMLAANGDKARAIAEYQRSIELNPANSSGKVILAKLQSQ